MLTLVFESASKEKALKLRDFLCEALVGIPGFINNEIVVNTQDFDDITKQPLNEEGDLVHPAIFAFAAWDQVRQYQTEQQAKPQHATAIHKPLHDDGALFVIQLYAGGIDLFLRDNQLVFQFLIFFF